MTPDVALEKLAVMKRDYPAIFRAFELELVELTLLELVRLLELNEEPS